MCSGRTILLLLIACCAAACTPSRAEVVVEALTALEQDGAEGLLPYLTRDGRRFVESLDLADFPPGDTGESIRCREEDAPADAGWRWVTCAQGERTLRIAVVDTGRGPRLDPFRWSFDPLMEMPGETSQGALP
ncbi:MAG: hypothetical protein ABIK09_07660 [Pseudomonadota bacterium]